jgi:LmbE family N-acetylglucosaminyl deacetylase
MECSRAVRAESTTVIVPLACGNHIDHVLVREAAVDCLSTWPSGTRLVFYEDLPYAAWADLGRVGDVLRTVQADVVPVVTGKSQLERKLELLSTYKSQLSTSDYAAVRFHFERVGGERLWCMTRPVRAAWEFRDAPELVARVY